jgi:hypothetical protein
MTIRKAAAILALGLSIPTMAANDWKVATGTIDNHPIIVRYITAPSVKPAEYPTLILITWKYKGTSNGMPDTPTGERMGVLEDLLPKKLESAASAYLAAVVTGNGRKEWYWYSRNEAESMKLLNEALAGQAAFPIQVSVQEDPTWSAHSQLAHSAK